MEISKPELDDIDHDIEEIDHDIDHGWYRWTTQQECIVSEEERD
jgi:hypothetical protein